LGSFQHRKILSLNIEIAMFAFQGSRSGVILFRPLSLSPLSVNAFMGGFVRRTDLEKHDACVAVVDPVHVRVRYQLKATE